MKTLFDPINFEIVEQFLEKRKYYVIFLKLL